MEVHIYIVKQVTYESKYTVTMQEGQRQKKIGRDLGDLR